MLFLKESMSFEEFLFLYNLKYNKLLILSCRFIILKESFRSSGIQKFFQFEETGFDFGILFSIFFQVFLVRYFTKKFISLEIKYSEFLVNVSIIILDYLIILFITYLISFDFSRLSFEVQSVVESKGDEVDDERSELVSEGRFVETDSENDFFVFFIVLIFEKLFRGKL